MLVSNTENVPDIIRRPVNEDYLRLNGRHFSVIKQSSATASNKHPTKNCKVCYAKGKRTASGLALRTLYLCGDCPSEPGLHVEECFKIYHTQLYYDGLDEWI